MNKNVASKAISSWKGRKRFYDVVDVASSKSGDGYHVLLDNRKLRTPRHEEFEIPTKELAIGIGHEWDAQLDMLQPTTMPLTILTNSSLILEEDKDERDPIINDVMSYLQTDTVLYHTSDNFHDKELIERERKYYIPLVEWMEKNYGKLDIVYADETLLVPKIPQATMKIVEERVQNLNNYELVAVENLTHACKSIICALGLLDHHLDVDNTYETSRVEEEHQAKINGFVEGAHDIDKANMYTQIASSAVFLDLIERS